MRALIYLYFVTLSLLASASLASVVNLDVPRVHLDVKFQQAHDAFTKQVRPYSRRLRSNSTDKIVVLAPFGGSKVTPLEELDADGLVILSWERPGTAEDIVRSFSEKTALRGTLEEALSGGAMNTSTVFQTPVAAQILARIFYELKSNRISVSYHLPNDKRFVSVEPTSLLKLWSGKVLNDNEGPLLMKFSFQSEGREKQLIFLSWKLTGDLTPSRTSLPGSTLRALSRDGYEWGYLSADGLILFSAMPTNKASKANAEFVSLLKSNGQMILDYPTGRNHAEDLGDFIAMAGRSPLEPWGFKLMTQIFLTQPVFGYSGTSKGDHVSIYAKKGAQSSRTTRSMFDMSAFRQIGPTLYFVLR